MSKDVKLVAEPKDKDLFVISYKGLGFAARIGNMTLVELLDIAKKSLESQENMDDRQEEGKKVRTKGKVGKRKAA